MTANEIKLHVGPSNNKGQRLVIAQFGEDSHRSRFDTDSATSRRRFFGELSQKTTIPVDDLVRQLDNHLVAAADDGTGRSCRQVPESPAEDSFARQPSAGVGNGVAPGAPALSIDLHELPGC